MPPLQRWSASQSPSRNELPPSITRISRGSHLACSREGGCTISSCSMYAIAMEERTYTVLPGQPIVLLSGVYHRKAKEADPTTKLIGITVNCSR